MHIKQNILSLFFISSKGNSQTGGNHSHSQANLECLFHKHHQTAWHNMFRNFSIHHSHFTLAYSHTVLRAEHMYSFWGNRYKVSL